MATKFLYKSYAGFYRFRCWRKRHFTPAGVMIVMAVFLSGILGFNIFKTILYQVFALSFSLLAVSMTASLLPFKFKVNVRRILPDYATVDDTAAYQIEITNLSSKSQKGLVLYEEITDPRPDLETLLSSREPFEHLRNAWDRKIMYYRWLWLIQKNEKARFYPVELPDLPVGETVCVTVNMHPLYRGILHFSGVTFARPDILGLFNRLFTIKAAQKLFVLPKRYQIDIPKLVSTRHYHAGGVSLASSIGNSDEFMSLRYYRPGDPLRNIHWKTFARTNEPVIKEFEDEYFARHALILDTFSTPDNDLVFEEAVSIASSFMSSLKNRDAILDLMFAGNRSYSFSSGRGLGHPEKMLEILSCVEPCRDKNVSSLIPLLQAGVKKISGAICIFSGWEEGHKKIHQMFIQAGVPAFIIVLAEDGQWMEKKIFQDRTATARIKVVHKSRIQKDLGGI